MACEHACVCEAMVWAVDLQPAVPLDLLQQAPVPGTSVHHHAPLTHLTHYQQGIGNSEYFQAFTHLLIISCRNNVLRFCICGALGGTTFTASHYGYAILVHLSG